MDAGLKTKWVEALRSGDYKQTQGRLLHEGAYCCLGVLCKLQGADVVTLPQTLCPPETLSGGLSLMQMHGLAEKNDSGLSFDQIAAFIEKKL